MLKRSLLMTAGVLFLGACSAPETSVPAALTVTAKAETDPVETQDDAADDPAIWRNAANPAGSLVIGTDKKAGIHVYDLAGKRLSFTPSPRLNNVDLRQNTLIDGTAGVLVAASNREDEESAKVSLFRLETQEARLVPLGTYPVGPGEAYGLCLWTRASDSVLFGFLVLKDGRIDQLRIDVGTTQPQVTKVRSLKLGSQSEGCVVDDRTGILYVAEENVGLWRFDADPLGSSEPVSIAKVDKVNLFEDVEGLALAPSGADQGYLIASSQGDNAYAVYRLPELTFVNRFRIGEGAIDGVSETDGIELMLGDMGPDYPRGLLVVQDGDNAPEMQNFKYVDWGAVSDALGL